VTQRPWQRCTALTTAGSLGKEGHVIDCTARQRSIGAELDSFGSAHLSTPSKMLCSTTTPLKRCTGRFFLPLDPGAKNCLDTGRPTTEVGSAGGASAHANSDDYQG